MVASWESGWSLVFVGGRGGGWGAWRDLWGVRVRGTFRDGRWLFHCAVVVG